MSAGSKGPDANGDPMAAAAASQDPPFKDPPFKGPAFKDHFSAVADAYAAARPEYPETLFDALAAVVPRMAHVWEPGCGSGQATRGLAAHFARVHASDPSAQQVAAHWVSRRGAVPEPRSPGRDRIDSGPANVSLSVEPGERTRLPDASVQLVAVAQALHWFDHDRFFAECDRVLTPGGVLAAWGYADFVAPEGMVDAVAAFRARVEPYWPPERAQVDTRYADYAWPFPALPAPDLWLEAELSFTHFLGYLSSSSASARCLAGTGDDPVARHAPALSAAWGAAGDTRTLRWPLFLHLRRKP